MLLLLQHYTTNLSYTLNVVSLSTYFTFYLTTVSADFPRKYL